MEETELVVPEEYKFENAAKKNETSVFWKFRIVKTLMRGTQIDKSPMEKLYTITKFLMPTPMEEMKPVVLVKYEFDYREKLFFSS